MYIYVRMIVREKEREGERSDKERTLNLVNNPN